MGEQTDRLFDKLERFYRDHIPAPMGIHRFFSIFVPLVERKGELCLLLEKRAEDMETDPGEICFPGGHVEPGETMRDCAVRETHEELGLLPEDVQVLGDGDILYGFANYTLYTTVGRIPYEAFLRVIPQNEEVGEVFLIPLSFFCENEPEVHRGIVAGDHTGFPCEKVGITADYNWRYGFWEIPIYPPYPFVREDAIIRAGAGVTPAGDGKTEVVWGLTANIIRHMIALLKKEGIL
ncbi:MAG: CoA pyrophosphatase [Firmicutes bacterium]|nr:CoA pyrophosphatase [Bacillota bacterium]